MAKIPIIFILTIASLTIISTSQHTPTPIQALKWNSTFANSSITLNMNSQENITLDIIILDDSLKNRQFQLKSENTHLATVPDTIIKIDDTTKTWHENVTISAHFLGNTQIYLELIKSNNETERSEQSLNLIIIRKPRPIDHVFTGSVALLVSLLYINFGAALDLNVLKGILKKPIGPVIGFLGQFLLMPVLSFALGYALFSGSTDGAALWLGLFFTGVSPAGGASNIWTVILQGNINLSIIMTTISTFAAFGMMPLWIFTLGKVIFDHGKLGVPYERIATFAIALVIPLFIGIGIQKFFPRVSRVLVRLLKPVSIMLILFIVIFAIVTNLYLFELFSWKIILAGIGLPWLGYMFGWCLAKVLRQNPPDAMAIAVETGIQNTGIAIFLLRFTLNQPEADLTTVVPVAVAIMTPLPLFVLYVVLKIVQRRRPKEEPSIIEHRDCDQFE